MAVIYEQTSGGLVRAQSNIGLMIFGGMPEGKYAVAFDPQEAGRTYVECDGEYVPTEPDDPNRPRSLSKRKLYVQLKAIGAWEQVKAYMEQSGVWEDWEYATTLDDDDPLLVSAIGAVKQALGLTDAQLGAILDAAVVA